MFSIHQNPFGTEFEIVIVNEVTKEHLQILPQFGGMINGLSLYSGSKLMDVIIGSKNMDELLEIGLVKFQGSKLFPFPNRINLGHFTFKDKSYQLPINEPSKGHALHGLVWNIPFQLTKKEIHEESASIELTHQSDGLLEYFPFKYELKIKYELHFSKGCTISTQIINLDTKELPMGDGWHPYFSFGNGIDELELEIPHLNTLEFDENMIPTGKLLGSNKFSELSLIGDTHFDHGFVLDQTKSTHITKLINRKSDMELHILQETGRNKYNFLQIYTPADRKSIAIEPMTCAPDVFNNKLGIIALAPNEKLELSFGIALKDV